MTSAYVSRDESGVLQLAITIGKDDEARWFTVPMDLSEDQFLLQASEPVHLDSVDPRFWLYRDRVVSVSDYGGAFNDELFLRIKHKVLRDEKALERLRRDVEGFERFEQSNRTPRTPIPAEVRMFVWERDRGRCVTCESNERLEYDHIIPLVKGGSNTERNVQLLCETCNRRKGSSIA